MLFLHGLWMSGIEAQVFRNRLESHHGLRTHVFLYPTHHETMAVVLERLAGVVAELQATQLHLVGHSLGGVITLRFLEAQAASLPPGRVRSKIDWCPPSAVCTAYCPGTFEQRRSDASSSTAWM